jgi:hypothetical protein
MRTGRKAEVHKASGSNGPISCRPGAAELIRREEADSGGNGGELSPPVSEKPDFDAVMSRAEERASFKPPKLGDVLGPQLRRTS